MGRTTCCVDGCYSSTIKGDRVFRFPKSLQRAMVWAHRVGLSCSSLQEAKVIHDRNVVCERHFSVDQFTTPQRQKLNGNAVPTIECGSGTQTQSEHNSFPMQLVSIDLPIHTEDVPPVPSTSDLHSDPLQFSSPSLTSQPLSLPVNEPSTPVHSSFPLPVTSTSSPVPNNPPQSSTPLQSLEQSCAESEASCSAGPNSIFVEAPAGITPPSVSTKKPKARRSLQLNHLGVRRVKDLTPRKQVLYNELKLKKGTMSKLRSRIRAKVTEIKDEETCDNFLVHALAYLQEAKELLLGILENCSRTPKGRRWNDDAKIVALVLQKQSRRAYVLLRKLFPLPSPRTLQSLLNSVPFGVGINTRLLATLQRSVQNLPESEWFCCLMFDDMSIRQNLFYNRARDCIEGFEDLGNRKYTRVGEVAKYALVFMVRGIQNRKFRQPVAYYFHNSLTAEMLIPLLKEVLDACADAGLHVLATVCDMGATNVSALKSMRKSEDSPYISCNERVYATVFDPPHLLKCTRNMLLKHDMCCVVETQDGPLHTGIAKWSHLKQLLEIDREQNELRCMYKVASKAHLEPNCQEKMRVCFAAHVMSRTVSTGLLTYASVGGYSEFVPTGRLVGFVNDLFDSCNGTGRPNVSNVGTRLRCQVDYSSPHPQFWAEARTTIGQWTFLKDSGLPDPDLLKRDNIVRQPPFVKGWLITIGAMEHVWKTLRENGVDSLATRCLNQDPLENTFGAIRAHCGGNNNPNVPQFVDGLKTCVINNLSVPVASKNTNCEEDDTSMLTNLHTFLKGIKTSEESEVTGPPDNTDDILFDAELYQDRVQNRDKDSDKNKLASGYVAKKVLEGRNCDACSKSLTTRPQLSHDTDFIYFKEFSDTEQALTYPTTGLVEFVYVAATLIGEILGAKTQSGRTVGASITTELKKLDFSWVDCPNHHQGIVDSIILSTIKICVPWWCKRRNQTISDGIRQRKLARKLGISEHINVNAISQ